MNRGAMRQCLHEILYQVFNIRTGEIERDKLDITDALDLMWYLNQENDTDEWRYRYSLDS